MPWKHHLNHASSQFRAWQSRRSADEARRRGDFELAKWHRDEASMHSRSAWMALLNALIAPLVRLLSGPK